VTLCGSAALSSPPALTPPPTPPHTWLSTHCGSMMAAFSRVNGSSREAASAMSCASQAQPPHRSSLQAAASSAARLPLIPVGRRGRERQSSARGGWREEGCAWWAEGGRRRPAGRRRLRGEGVQGRQAGRQAGRQRHHQHVQLGDHRRRSSRPGTCDQTQRRWGCHRRLCSRSLLSLGPPAGCCRCQGWRWRARFWRPSWLQPLAGEAAEELTARRCVLAGLGPRDPGAGARPEGGTGAAGAGSARNARI
jgi:hypothetical protein